MTAENRSPYPGLRAYEPSESDLFFGREDCVDEMLESLARTRFLAVLGNSGSGKSSLVRTGLLDALELGFLPNAGSDWKIVDMHPGGRPLQNLAAAVLRSEGEEADDIDLNLMRGQMSRGPRSLMQWCDEGNLDNDQSLLLLVDQFEELFRYQDYAGREEAEAFVALLLESAKSHPRIHVVLTMRSEYLGACALMRGLAERINAGLYLTPRMSRSECEEAIVGPAKVLGFEVEPRLVNHILNDMASFAPWEGEDKDSSLVQLARRADQLPLMQHVLNRLWAAARDIDPDNPVLRFDDYEAVGGLSGAVNDHAEEVLASLSDPARRAAHLVFKALMSGSNISDAVRAPRPFGALAALVGDPEVAREVVDAFRAPGCNFLRPPLSVSLDDKSIVDLGHESLIRQWGRLQGWLAEDTRAATQWARLAAAQAAEAESAGELLSGLDLDIAREWWSNAKPSAAWAEGRAGDFESVKDFLRRSVDASDARAREEAAEAKRKTRNLRLRAASYLGVALVAVGAAVYSFNARSEAVAAAGRAEAATQTALLAQERAERSNTLALNATDTFLLDTAEQLSGAVGVPDDQVDKLLGSAVEYVDELATEIEDSAALDALRAAVIVRRAGLQLARGEQDIARQNIAEAEEILGFGYDHTEPLSPQQVAAFLELMSFRYRDLNEMRQYDDLLPVFDQTLSFFDAHGHVLDDDDQLLWELAIQNGRAIALTAIGQVEESRELSLDCLDRLQAATGAPFERRRLNCAITIAYSYAGVERPAEIEQVIEDTLERTSPSQFTITTWDNWLYLQIENISSLSNNDRHDEVVDLSNDVRLQLEGLLAAEPENWDLRTRRNWLYRFNLESLLETDQPDEAYALAVDAFDDIRNEPEVWQTNGNGVVSVNVALEQMAKAAGAAPADVDPQEAAQFQIDMLELHLEVLLAEDRLLDQTACTGCNLTPYLELAGAYERLYGLGSVEKARAHFAAHDRLHLDANEVLRDDTQSIYSKGVARRAVYLMMQSLPDGTNFDDRISQDDQLFLLNQSILRLKAFHSRHPGATSLRVKLSDAYVALAEIMFARGQVFQAEATLKLAVNLDGLRAIRLMQRWLETGSGPLVQDVEAARAMTQERITTRDWTVGQQEVFARQDWVDGASERNHNMPVYDAPLGSSESAMSNAIQEFVLQGYYISEAEIEELMGIEEAAQGADLTTVRYIMNRGELPSFDRGNPDQVAAELVRHTEENQVIEGARVLLHISQNETDSAAIISAALDAYLNNEAEAGYFRRLQFVEAMSLAFARAEYHDIGISLHSKLLERGGQLPVADHANLLRQRGAMHRELGDHEASLSDLLTALAMQPDDPRLLNSIGYAWADNEEMLPAAIKMLERAVEIERQVDGSTSLHFYIDSLGWLYVQSGDLESGMEKLQEAIAIDAEPQAEILFHVGETFRRMGDPAEAIVYFEQALDVVERSDIREQIYAQLQLAEAALQQ